MSKVQDKPVPLTDKEISEQDARFTIDGAIALGRIGANPPPAGHWLAEYWSIGQQLAALGKTSAWDNQTPVDAPSLTAGGGLTDEDIDEMLDINSIGDGFDTAEWRRNYQFDVEALIRECVPGGSICDPQAVADAIRAYAAPRQPRKMGTNAASPALERMCSGRDWWEHALPNSDLARPAAAAAAQRNGREAIAWVHEDDPGRAISAPQKAQMLRDGGASASSVKGYSIAAVARAAQQIPGADQAALGFTISDGKDCGIRVLAWDSGGCRPAEETECAMWDMLAGRQPHGDDRG